MVNNPLAGFEFTKPFLNGDTSPSETAFGTASGPATQFGSDLSDIKASFVTSEPFGGRYD
jgi:hypothetical protein